MGLIKPICVYGRIKGTSLVGEHKIYPLLNSENYPAYEFGYWLIQQYPQGWVILNVLFL